MAQGFQEADRQASKRSDVSKGLKWTLSSTHNHTDVCDVLAYQDEFGLGRGVYPEEKAPPIAHPFCTCSYRFVFEDSEFDEEAEDFNEKQTQQAKKIIPDE